MNRAIATLISLLVLMASCNKPEVSNGDDNGNGDTVCSHEYVDLGLPSGTLWATCNVGAEAPEDYGDYYAWGEDGPKAIYAWKNYKYGDFNKERYELNKYCTNSDNGLEGFVDDLTILEPDDDVATTCWGEDWRMPTKGEWEELLQYTTSESASLNGVVGWLFTAANGNTLFFPAAGYWWEDDFNHAGLGVYWSSSVNKEFPYRAWGFHFNSDSCHICGSSDRNRGQTVRPVRCSH